MLMSGTALTATELAAEADVAPSTASAHLAKLTEARLLTIEKQGRHRYYRLSGTDVAEMLEDLAGMAARTRHRPRPADPALRLARICYDHLAGELGVWMFERMKDRGLLAGRDAPVITKTGASFFAAFGVDVERLATARRALCRTCLDWSERRHHLAGSLGAAILQRIFSAGWARRETGSRAIVFSRNGERMFRARFG
jgi:hypothetical protein